MHKLLFIACLNLFINIAVADIFIRDYQAVSVNSSNASPENLILQINTTSTTISIELSTNQVLLNALTQPQRIALETAQQGIYVGQIDGVNDSWARLSRIDGKWSGGFFDGQQLWLLDQAEALQNVLQAQPATTTSNILYRLSDFSLDQVVDDGGILPPDTISHPLTGRDIINALDLLNTRGDSQDLLMTIVTDTQFNNALGSNTVATVMSRFNLADGIFSSQVGVGLRLDQLEMLSDNGPLTAIEASDLLNAFRNFVNSSANGVTRNGSNHLFTGRNIQSTNPDNGNVSTGVAGIAFLGVLCSTFAYGVNENLNSNTTSALIFTHELGHNFNAPHDRQNGSACVNSNIAGIMNPSINGSQQFSDCSLAQMAPEVAQASCLVDSNETFFVDGFEAF